MEFYNKEKLLDNKGRSNYINNIKFLLITLVVVGHMLTSVRTGDPVARLIYNSIYIFHMPAFIMITGYLSKGAVRTLDKMKKSILNYIVLYLYAQIVYDLVQRWALPAGQSFEFSILTPRYALWYMYLLIFWIPLLYVVKRYSAHWVVGISFSLALLAGLNTEIGTDYSLSRAIVFLPFFLIGYFFDLEKFKTYVCNKTKFMALLVLVANPIVQALYLDKISATWYTASVSYAGMGQTSIVGISIRSIYMISAFLIVLALLALVPEGEFIFSYIGSRTLQIYLIHAIICRVFYIRGTLIPIKEFTNVWFIIFLGVCMTLALSYKKLSIIVEWPTKLLYNKR